MEQTPENRRQMIALLRSAMTDIAKPNSEQIDDEQLTLLAMGQIDRLPSVQRQTLLRQVAAQPWAAQLVAELSPILGIREHRTPNYKWLPRIGRVLAIAACVSVVLIIWQGFDPSPHSVLSLRPFGVGNGPDYWGQFHDEQMQARAFRNWMRDMLTIVMCTTTVILAIAVAWMAFRERHRRDH